jgi:hypothetical protein
MKKIVALCLVLGLLFSFSACGPKSILEADHDVYTIKGMSITLPEVFEEASYTWATIVYHTPEVTIFVLREVAADMTLPEYAQAVYEANAYRSPSAIAHVEGLTTMEYTFVDPAGKATICYFSAMLEGPDAFWLIQFSCDEEDYETYRPYFIEWAKTVTFES